MAYMFWTDEDTGRHHIFECNNNGSLKSKESICGIKHDDHKLIYLNIEPIYQDEDEIELANRAYVLFAQGKKVCGRCVACIYGEEDID